MHEAQPGSHTASMRSHATRCVALAVVLLSLLSRGSWRWPYQVNVSDSLLALIGLTAVLIINNGDVAGLRLRLAPIQGWWYWFRMALWFGLVIAGMIAACTWAWLLLGWEIPFHSSDPARFHWLLMWMCVNAPVTEEVVYRSLLAVALAPTFGRCGTVLIGGLVFAVAHVIGGNPGPDNQIAGFLLMWAFLHSGTILVPLAMHSAGNLIALLVQIGNWYLFSAN